MAAKSREKSSRPRKSGKTDIRQQKRQKDVEDLDKLEAEVAELDAKSIELSSFTQLPLSHPTVSGLKASHFQTLTDVQQRAIPLALKGNDLLGAAKTGSGKTLAFLVPVLEKLYRARWTEYDGLGALILSPTRELAVQIFEVLRKVGRFHSYSAGLVIGGKSLKEEAERLSRMNILVCTPGRMLQHLDQTAGFEAGNLQILVLDEADRIMDMGFQSAVDALVEHLPKTRQTLMFSATQSKKVSDLARLNLKDPEYVSVHEAATTATPTNLQQHYIVTSLPDKLDTLYGFIKSNLKSKIIVFLSSGKQVRFVYEAFRHLQPGIPLLHLHGRQRQVARLEITSRFIAAKQSCLFATDVVARGIDFPAVDWVIQADCPEDVDTYIHRVGRTARYQSNGRAVLFLDPSEETGMIQKLEQKKIPIQKVHVREKKKREIKNDLQNMCFKNPDLKYLGQKAFISYTRAIHLRMDKSVFQLKDLDLDGFAASMGLPGTPQIKFQRGVDIKKIKNAPRANLSSGSESDEGLTEDATKMLKTKDRKSEVRTKYDRMFERQNQDVLSRHYSSLVANSDETQNAGAEDEDLLTVKRRLNDDDLDATIKGGLPPSTKILSGLGGDAPYVVDSKRREKVLQSKKKMLKFKGNPTKLVYDDDGVPHALYELQRDEDFQRQGPVQEQRQRFLDDEAARVRDADVDDKLHARQRKREKREKRKAMDRAESGLTAGPRLGGMAADVAEDGEDPLALMRSLPLPDAADADGQPLRKKARKGADNERTRQQGDVGRRVTIHEAPKTLEDLERVAAGLLDG